MVIFWELWGGNGFQAKIAISPNVLHNNLCREAKKPCVMSFFAIEKIFFSKGAVAGLFGISFLDRRGVELRDRMNNKVLDANGTGISGIFGGGYSFICPHILSVYSLVVVMFCLLPATIVCFFALIV